MLRRARSSCQRIEMTVSLDAGRGDGRRERETDLHLDGGNFVGDVGSHARDSVVEDLHVVASDLAAHRREPPRLLLLAREVALRSLLDGLEIALEASADRRQTRDLSCRSTVFPSRMARVGGGEDEDDVVLAGRMIERFEGGLELALAVDKHGVSFAFDPNDGLLHLGHLGLGVILCSRGFDEFRQKRRRKKEQTPGVKR
jgi:hypothetical protein